MSEYKLVPVEPTDALLRSMAMRYRHDFGLLCPTQQNSVLTQMRQIHEEVVGTGFYRAPSPEWVKTSDRLPTPEDADERGRLWAVHTEKQSEYGPANTPFIAHWAHLEYLKKYTLATHWMPKPRVQPPEPPEVE